MRFVQWSILCLALAAVAGCGSSFSTVTGESQDAAGDGSDEGVPELHGTTPGDAGDGGSTADARDHDATASETEAEAGEGGSGDDAGEGAAPGCPGGDIECNQNCVPSDVHNCGACGHDCTNLPHVAGATSCTAEGSCSFPGSACAPGWADCNGQPDDGCETDVTTPAACGSCSNLCPASDPTCAGGTCVSGCPAQTPILCGGTCVDTSTNANDCDGCGKGCTTTVANSQPTCTASACSFACNSGFSGCPTAGPTACVDEQDDANNCGACGKTCAGPTSGTGQAACASGGCTLNCSAGLSACPAAAPTECANTTTDLSNCGSCGDACTTAVANAHATCGASQCGFACNTGFLECNGNSCLPLADTTNGAFVSETGGAGSICSATAPCATVAAAIATGKTTIYLDHGSYDEVVSVPSGVSIHGGWSFSGTSWTNCGATNTTSILSAPAGQTSAVLSSGAGALLDTLTIENATTAVAGQTMYGVFVNSGSLALTDVAIHVSAGGNGTPGTTPGPGAPPGAAKTCAADTGASGSPGTPVSTAAMGSYSAAGYSPGTGATGAMGGIGHAGTAAPIDGQPGGPTCALGDRNCCTSATAGCVACTTTPESCGTAGTPGCGSGGSAGGTGGSGGGSSIGVFVWGGTVSVSGSIAPGAGGAGGAGGPGGAVVSGGPGTAGAASLPVATACSAMFNGTFEVCDSTGTTQGAAGSAGGVGGTGGQGSTGGGGSGGDSYCYYAGTGGQVTATGLSCTPGQAGPGGNLGSVNQGASGTSARNN